MTRRHVVALVVNPNTRETQTAVKWRVTESWMDRLASVMMAFHERGLGAERRAT